MAQILIVEDDATLQDAYSFILGTSGHTVASAYNGLEGLEHVRSTAFDIILLDIHMPIMDGFEFLEQYQHEHPVTTKVIVFSNMIEPEIELRATRLGAHQCILKSSMTPAGMLKLVADTVD